MFKVVDYEHYKRGIVQVLTDNEENSLIQVDIGSMAGPGAWRRVLQYLEDVHQVQDTDHLLAAWKYGLIGDWHY